MGMSNINIWQECPIPSCKQNKHSFFFFSNILKRYSFSTEHKLGLKIPLRADLQEGHCQSIRVAQGMKSDDSSKTQKSSINTLED